MKAYLLDTTKQEIKEVQVTDWQDISKLIGNNCELFTCPIIFENNDTVYCDDEGLLKPFYGGVLFKDYPQPLVGNMLILGSDDEGESKDVEMTKNQIEEKFQWLTKNDIVYGGWSY
jgi:hypothetical protein